MSQGDRNGTAIGHEASLRLVPGTEKRMQHGKARLWANDPAQRRSACM